MPFGDRQLSSDAIRRAPPQDREVGRLTITLLGGFQVRQAAGDALVLPMKKTQALLAYLALRPGQAYQRDGLAALLWGDRAEEQARKSLRQAMYVLRKTLPATQPASLLTEGETIALNPTAVEVDVPVFERLLGEGTPEALERVAALYRGDLLEGLNVNEAPFEEWLIAERERLRESALAVFAKLLAHQSKAGQTERAIQTGVRLLALDPLQEVVHRALMRLYVYQGRRGAALKQYKICVATLERELSTEPEPETKQLYHDIRERRTSEPLKAGAQPAREKPRTPLESHPELFAGEAPLIGRESEMARLRDVLDQASQGRGHVAVIVGEAGIGKSSVLMALAAEAHTRGVRILLGHSHRTEQVLAFGPWVDALRSARVVSDVEIFAGLPPLWRGELVRLLPELGHAKGEVVSASPDHLRLFEAVTELVRHLATKRPVLVMLEDLQWADDMSGRLVAFFARRIAGSRVLFVVTIREEELASTELLRHVFDELSRESHFVPLTLSPLTRADTRALVRFLTRAAPSEAVAAPLDEQIWRVSKGNPFVAVEAIRALQEGTSPEPPAALPLTERLRRVVAERLDRLSDRGRHLVSVAAAIGREFDFALLQRAAGLDEREAAAGVEELVQRRVLHGLGERFDFTHERLREVAYDQLLQLRRKVLHAVVAKALEDLYAGGLEPYYAALAGHYQAAEIWEKALTYFHRTGVRAMRLSAYREAVACFEQALEALSNLPKTRETLEADIDLRFDLRTCLLLLGEIDRTRRHLQDAELLTRQLDDPRRLGWVSAYMSHYFRIAGDSMEASRLAGTAQCLAESLGDLSLRLAAEMYLGAACVSLGDYRRAADSFRGILRSLDDDLSRPPLGNTEFPAVLARAWLAQSLAELGEFEEGRAFGEEAIRIAEALDHPMSLANACLRLGHLHRVKGELERAVLLLERGRGITRDRKITFTAAIVTGDLGHMYALLGRVAEGFSLLRDAMEAHESMKAEVAKARLLAHFGEAYLLAGRLEDAHASAGRSLAHTRERGERGYEAQALRLLGEIVSHRDPPDVETAEGLYREAMTLAAGLGMRPLVAHCHRGLGTLYRQSGKTHAAREHLTAAVMMFESMGMRFWLAKAEAEVFSLR